MTTKNGNPTEDAKMLQYVLEDFLELKTSLVPQKAKSLKNFLLSQDLAALQLLPAEGFLLDTSLVVFGKTNPQSITHLVFVDPQTGKVQIKRLPTP